VVNWGRDKRRRMSHKSNPSRGPPVWGSTSIPSSSCYTAYHHPRMFSEQPQQQQEWEQRQRQEWQIEQLNTHGPSYQNQTATRPLQSERQQQSYPVAHLGYSAYRSSPHRYDPEDTHLLGRLQMVLIASAVYAHQGLHDCARTR
jgi:hypothetical protein